MLPKLMLPHTVTLYNHYRTQARVDAWKRTVLNRTQYAEIIEKSMTQNGIVQLAVMATVIIGYRSGYVSPSVFSAAEDKTDIWTINAKKNMDVIVYGNCEQEIAGGYTLDDLIDEYNGKIVQSFRDNTTFTLLRHWEVGCV